MEEPRMTEAQRDELKALCQKADAGQVWRDADPRRRAAFYR